VLLPPWTRCQAQLLARCEDLGRRIRDLGSLSAEAFDKYQGRGVKVRTVEHSR